LYLENMKTTFNRSELDMSVRASREPVLRSTWVLLAMTVLVAAAPRASDADPLPTCRAMCQRFTDCRMSSYTKSCLDYCKQQGYEASEEGRAQLLTAARSSCEQIQQIASAVQRELDHHQRSSTRTPSPPTSSRTGSNDDADELDQLDQRGADAPARGLGRPGMQRGRAAPGRSSRSGDNCAPVCDRFEQCRLWKHDSCMGYCSSNTVDPAKNLVASQWSCQRLGSWMQQLGVSGSSSPGDPRYSGNSGGVTCTAEASLGTAQGNMPTIYRTITAMGNGPTRGAASVKALKDCGALVGNAQNLAWLSGEQTEGGNCAISRCTQ
jgi:hypothetical protein